jgi:C-terminal processing protease CtpA/Prc
MTIARGSALLALLLVGGTSVMAQDASELDARSRDLAERMRVTLQQHARMLSQMQRDLQRASRADSRARDSIVRATSQQISELATELARVQMEADRVEIRSTDAQTRAQLRAQIASARAMANVTRALAGQQRALTFMSTRAPRGYLGVTLSGEQNTELRDGKVYTIYESPLSIELVVPDSPAARAGLVAGDTILAFGKLAVPGAVPLADVLTPGERLPVKIRRDGRDRTVTVVVGESQSNARGFTFSLSPNGSAGAGRSCSGDECGPMITLAPLAPSAPTPATPGVPMTPPVPPVATTRAPAAIRGSMWSASDYALAGAMMTTITDDLEELTGVDEGILVLRVAPGTPAASSGLRGGDVIAKVNDEDCEGVRDLQLAVQRASSRGGRQVALVVIRQKKERAITLQW